MSETKSKVWWQLLLSKYVVSAIGAIATGVAIFVNDGFERFWLDKDAVANAIAREDSLRVFLHRTNAIEDALEHYHLRADKSLIPDTTLIEQTLLLRFSRSDIHSDLTWDNYNIISILYEYPRTYRYDNKDDWQNVNVDRQRPGIRIFLMNIARRGSLYTWNRSTITEYDEKFVPKDVYEDYLIANGIDVILYKHLGYTRDFHEHWYAQSVVDSAVWATSNRYRIRNEFNRMCNDMQQRLRLYKTTNF